MNIYSHSASFDFIHGVLVRQEFIQVGDPCATVLQLLSFVISINACNVSSALSIAFLAVILPRFRILCFEDIYSCFPACLRLVMGTRFCRQLSLL